MQRTSQLQQETRFFWKEKVLRHQGKVVHGRKHREPAVVARAAKQASQQCDPVVYKEKVAAFLRVIVRLALLI